MHPCAALPCSPAGTYQPGDDHTVCLACPVGTYRSGSASPVNNNCTSIPPGYKASLQSFADLALASVQVSDSATLDAQVKTPAGAAYSGLLKTGIAPCPTGTEAFLNGNARVPAAVSGATYAATVTADNSCKACDANMYASKTGTPKCQLCKAGAFPTRSFPASNNPEPGNVARGNDQCTLCPTGFYKAPQSSKATCDVCPAGYETRVVLGAGQTPKAALTPVETALQGLIKRGGGTGLVNVTSDESAGGDKANVDLPGIHIRSDGGKSQVKIFGVTIDSDDEHDKATVHAGSGDKQATVNADDHGATIRADDTSNGNVETVFILAGDPATADGYHAVGYIARGPAAGPLVVAQFKSKHEHQHGHQDNLDDLIRRNAKGS